MNTISKTLGILALALMLPLSAGAAIASQSPQTPTIDTATVSSTPTIKTDLFAKAAKPETIKVAGRRHRGRGLAVGIVAGAAAAALLTAGARRHHYYNERPYYRARARRSYRRHQRRCDRWAYNCDCGIQRACRRYYRNCE